MGEGKKFEGRRVGGGAGAPRPMGEGKKFEGRRVEGGAGAARPLGEGKRGVQVHDMVDKESGGTARRTSGDEGRVE